MSRKLLPAVFLNLNKRGGEEKKTILFTSVKTFFSVCACHLIGVNRSSNLNPLNCSVTMLDHAATP